MLARRLIADVDFPAFAYVPGLRPRPAPDHVALPSTGWDQFRWGIDLFNYGYYWEAHEVWEPLWRSARKGSRRRLLIKGLIALCAAGVKAHQGNPIGGQRHARRAASIFRRLGEGFERGSILGLSPAALLRCAEMADAGMLDSQLSRSPDPQVLFELEIALSGVPR
jgi:uncharacterized protein